MKVVFTLFFLLFGQCVLAQDERFFRQLISGDLGVSAAEESKTTPHFHAASPFYEIDLDGDDRVEYIVIEKRDSEDWLHIHDYNRKRIFSLKFVRLGWESDVFRINLRQLSKDTKVLLVRYYEGHNQGENFTGTGRLYVVSWDKNDLKSLRGVRGPQLWDEFADSKIHYHQRPQHISLFDFDSDGIREVAVRHHLTTKVMKYIGKGEWSGN